MAFVSVSGDTSEQHIRAIVQGVNSSLRGETANTGTFTAISGETSHTVTDSRFGVGRCVVLVPTNASAAGSLWYVHSVMNGTMIVNFATALSADASFMYAIIGSGTGR